MPIEVTAAAARAAARLSKALEIVLGETGLTLPQYRLLGFLAEGPERAVTLAQWLEVSPPTLTALVDGLVAKGFVARVATVEDRRGVRHLLTPQGQQALTDGDTAVTRGLAKLAEELPAAPARKAVACLELWGQAIDSARVKLDVPKNGKSAPATATATARSGGTA